jgi:uncharacterized membrane protein YdfJ with MMPL/SSD domain
MQDPTGHEQCTKDLVTHLRDKADEIRAMTGVEALITGTTALNIDTADRLSAALPKYVAIVVGLALLLLTVVPGVDLEGEALLANLKEAPARS